MVRCASVLARKFVDKAPLWEPHRAAALLGAEYLSPGREPWVPRPSPRPALRDTPLPPARRPEVAYAPELQRRSALGRRAGERGEGEREGAFNPRLTPWAKLCRSFGAGFFNEPLSRDTKCAVTVRPGVGVRLAVPSWFDRAMKMKWVRQAVPLQPWRQSRWPIVRS
jgi:hypothetical protein